MDGDKPGGVVSHDEDEGNPSVVDDGLEGEEPRSARCAPSQQVTVTVVAACTCPHTS